MVSHLTVHELARTFTSGHATEGKALFAFVRDLYAQIDHPPVVLWSRERKYLDGGVPVVSRLDSRNRRFTRSHINRLADGRLGSELTGLIHQRAADKLKFGRSTEFFLEQVKQLRRDEPSAIPKISDFPSAVKMFAPSALKFIQAMSDSPMSDDVAQRVLARIDELPAHRSHHRFWLYMMFICIKTKQVPGRDKLDDYRHVIEASYCDIFVSRDRQQLYAAPLIGTHLTAIAIDDVLDRA